MGLRYTAWTLPWSGDFYQKVADVPRVLGTGRGQRRLYSTGGTGSVEIDLTDFLLTDIVSDTEGSLVRVYDSDTLIHEWLAERPSQQILDTASKAKISGNNLQSIFDKYIVFNFDYPIVGSVQSNWVWGGGNLLSNPGFENTGATPQEFELAITATGGTYTLSDGVDTTDPISFDAQAGTISTDIQDDLALIDDVSTAGTSVAPYLRTVTMVTPATGNTLTINPAGLTGGGGTLDETIEGEIGFGPWTTNRYSQLSLPADGGYPTFEISTVQARSGTQSLAVQPGTIYPLGGRNPGIQQVLSVTPSQLYQWSLWVYPTSGTDIFEVGLYTYPGDDKIATASPSVTANQWNELSISDVVIPDGITQVRAVAFWRNYTNTSYSPSLAYWDDGELTEGQPPSSPGTILTALFDDAAVDHSGDARGTPLDWVDYSSWSATLDSNGAAWTSAALTIVAFFGETYGQILDKFVDLGYEWELVPKAGPITPGNPTHDLHMYNTGGRDSSPTAIVNIGQAVSGGEVVKRIPDYTRVLVADSEGNYIEDEDATAVSDFGPMEKFTRISGETNSIALAARGDEMLAAEASNRAATKVKLTPVGTDFRPLVDYEPGDTVPIQLPPTLPKTDKRIVRVDYIDKEDPEYTVVGSRVFGDSAAAFELVRRLWRRFLVPERPREKTGVSTGGVKGGVPRYVIAASDASQRSKDKADATCTGSNCDEELTIALEESDNGEIRFTEGTFAFSADRTIPDGCFLSGAGAGSGTTGGTLFDFSADPTWTWEGNSGARHIGRASGGA